MLISRIISLASDIVNRGHIDTGHGHKLERIIIYLIMIEVFFECLHFYERYFACSSRIPQVTLLYPSESMVGCRFLNPETQVPHKKLLNCLQRELLPLPSQMQLSLLAHLYLLCFGHMHLSPRCVVDEKHQLYGCWLLANGYAIKINEDAFQSLAVCNH